MRRIRKWTGLDLMLSTKDDAYIGFVFGGVILVVGVLMLLAVISGIK